MGDVQKVTAKRKSTVTTQIQDLDKVEFEAYRQSCDLQVPDMSNYLVKVIGVQMTAVGAGLADGRPVRSWQDGSALPRPGTQDRLRLLFRVTQVIDAVYGPQTTRAFLRSASPYLGNRAPLEVIADDDIQSAQVAVLGAVRGFIEA